MKFKKLAGMAVILAICGGTIMTASAENKRIAVTFNGTELNNAGEVSEAGLLELANQVQSIVDWDESAGRMSIYKPNVDLIFIQSKDSGLFGKVNLDDKVTFSVAIQVDHLLTDVSSVKIEMTDPNGKLVPIQTLDNKESKEDSFWGLTDRFTYTFDTKGTCIVRVSMKSVATGKWFVVKEKPIVVV